MRAQREDVCASADGSSSADSARIGARGPPAVASPWLTKPTASSTQRGTTRCWSAMPSAAIRTWPGTTRRTIPVGGTSWSAPARPSIPIGFFVICPNLLGGCRGTTGPGQHQSGHRQALWAAISPPSPSATWWRCNARLLDHLGITNLHGGGGRLLGGHQALTWADPLSRSRARRRCSLATSPRLTSQALAFDVVGRNAILRDPALSRRPVLRPGRTGPKSAWPSPA